MDRKQQQDIRHKYFSMKYHPFRSNAKTEEISPWNIIPRIEHENVINLNYQQKLLIILAKYPFWKNNK